MSEIKFKYGTQEQYDSVETPTTTDIYFTTESVEGSNVGTIYKGSEIMGTSVADKLIIPEDIDIIGTSAGLLANGDTIPAGSSIVDLLKQMLQTELWPSTITAATSKITVSPSSSSVEVGSTVSTSIYGTFTEASYKTYTTDNKLTESTVSMDMSLVDGYTISRTSPSSATVGTQVASGSSNAVTDSVALTTDGAKSTYSLAGSRTGATYTLMSNMGNTNDMSYAAATLTTVTATSATAYFRYFVGCVNGTDPSAIDQSSLSDLVALSNVETGSSITTNALMTSSSKTIADSSTVIASTATENSIVIAIPTTFSGIAMLQGMTGDNLASSCVTSTFDYTIGETTTEYTVYMLATNQGAQQVKGVSITK